MQLDRDYDTQCKQVWAEAWVRVAQASNCTTLSSPTRYADECLSEFKKRFKDNTPITITHKPDVPTEGGK